MTDATQNSGNAPASGGDAAQASADQGAQAGTQQQAAVDAGKAPQGAPEKYADFKLPDGVKLEGDDLAGITTFAKDMNLTQEQAQKLVDRDIKARADAETALKTRHEGVVAQWGEMARTDKDIGGDKFDANLAVAKKAIDTFGSPELKQYLNETGLGNHPEVIKTFLRIGQQISEDKLGSNVNGDQAPTKTAAQVLYPSMAH